MGLPLFWKYFGGWTVWWKVSYEITLDRALGINSSPLHQLSPWTLKFPCLESTFNIKGVSGLHLSSHLLKIWPNNSLLSYSSKPQDVLLHFTQHFLFGNQNGPDNLLHHITGAGTSFVYFSTCFGCVSSKNSESLCLSKGKCNVITFIVITYLHLAGFSIIKVFYFLTLSFNYAFFFFPYFPPIDWLIDFSLYHNFSSSGLKSCKTFFSTSSFYC